MGWLLLFADLRFVSEGFSLFLRGGDWKMFYGLYPVVGTRDSGGGIEGIGGR